MSNDFDGQLSMSCKGRNVDIYQSPGARVVLHNLEDRKGSTMGFDRLKHPLFGKVARGFKSGCTFCLLSYRYVLTVVNSGNKFIMKVRLKVEAK